MGEKIGKLCQKEKLAILMFLDVVFLLNKTAEIMIGCLYAKIFNS